MIYTQEEINKEIEKYLHTFPNHGHSKLAEIMQSTGSLSLMSHRSLRRQISELREAKKTQESGNILVIPDLHAPFILDGSLEFIKGLQKKYNTSRTVFIGDITDQHAASFHAHDPDGLSISDELYFAKEQLKDWYNEFPIADVMMGNHDFRIQRQAKKAGLPKNVLRPYKEVIEAPEGWTFHDNELVINDIIFTHGSIGDAIQRAKDSRQSVVQGHLHTKAYVQWAVSNKDKIFGMQVGCLIDRSSYAMAYASDNAKKPVISAGVLIDGGKLPLVELMDL